MKRTKKIRQRALRAAKAVTMGAAIVGLGVGCNSTDDNQPDVNVGEDTNQADTGSDNVVTDAGTDTASVDVSTDTSTTDTTVEDLGNDTTESDVTEEDIAIEDVSTKVDVEDEDADAITITPDEGSADTAEVGCENEPDEVCPEKCTQDNDADCCYEWGDGFIGCEFIPDEGCMCAIPGPFVAPEMIV
ncbi:MAG: hypothetical protein CMH54_10915 [Myxococcales bacterium]|nr:hypothetical protein [Myxococcales bacterium]|tara:strand:+ start:1164 stop:1727 length:564 start_codon:yes stop_codon:yes gene_type:complete